mmetsp:Transcript_5503/g.7675  ORF Transcript_5503/g.7675 Transcript_5503/m.7675 type:complete len:191 (+) Transcript_5503:3-575(+)
MANAISGWQLKEKLYSILTGQDLSDFTKKQARCKLESEFGLEKDALKPRRKEINEFLRMYLEEHENDEENGEVEEEKNEQPPKKKAKKEEVTEKKASTFETITRSGKEAPKKLKDLQNDLMAVPEFFRDAENIEINLHGNKMIGRPRSFASENLGWYLGGKIQIPIGGKLVWCQAGINITIPGSKEWSKD